MFLQGQGDEDRVLHEPPVREQSRHSVHRLLPFGEFLQLHQGIVGQRGSVLIGDVIQHFEALLRLSLCREPSWRFRKLSAEEGSLEMSVFEKIIFRLKQFRVLTSGNDG